MSSGSKKSRRNDKSTRPKKTSRRLPPPSSEEESETLRHLVERVEKQSSRVKVVTNVPGEEKMSVALSRLIKPYVHLADDMDAYERLVALAGVSWNATILNPEQRDKLLREVEKNLPESMLQESREMIADLMERKKRYFVDNERMILSYEIIDLPEYYRLAVVSTLTAEGKEKALAQLAGIPVLKRKKPSLIARILAFFRR